MPTATPTLAPLPPSNIPMFGQGGQLTREWYLWYLSVDEVLRGLREEVDSILDDPLNDVMLVDGLPAPTAVVGSVFIYVDMTTGDLMVRFGDGVTKTLATDT